MMTIKEMSRRTGVSIRTLQYYDRIGLLRPAAYTQSSYRLYDDTDLERMQQILLFRELRFHLPLSASSLSPQKANESHLRSLSHLPPCHSGSAWCPVQR